MGLQTQRAGLTKLRKKNKRTGQKEAQAPVCLCTQTEVLDSHMDATCVHARQTGTGYREEASGAYPVPG